MKKNPLILGIETSCDETAASIISQEKGEVKILSNGVSKFSHINATRLWIYNSSNPPEVNSGGAEVSARTVKLDSTNTGIGLVQRWDGKNFS